MLIIRSNGLCRSPLDNFGLTDSLALQQRISSKLLPLDVKESDKVYEVLVDVPGIPKENVSLELQDDVLTVSVLEKRENNGSKSDKFHWKERSFGQATRKVRLPKGIDRAAISANQNNGVLSIVLPKAEEALDKVRKINVTANT